MSVGLLEISPMANKNSLKVTSRISLLLAIPLIFALHTNAAVAQTCQLTVGWDPWHPYTFRGPDDELTGLDIELIRLIAERAECSLDFIQVPWKRLLEELKHDRLVDVVTGASRTPEREQYALYSVDYRQEVMKLHVRHEDLPRRDYYYGPEFDKAMEDPQFRQLAQSVETDHQNYKKLELDRIDGFLADPFSVTALAQKSGPSGWIVPHPMHVHSSKIHFMFSKAASNEDVLSRFNEAIETATQSGELDSLIAKYLNY